MRNVEEGPWKALLCILFLFVLYGSAWASNPEISAVLDDDGRVTVNASFTDYCEPWQGYVRHISIGVCPGDYSCCWGCSGVAGADGYSVSGTYNASKGKGGTLTFTARGAGGRWSKNIWGQWRCVGSSFEASTKILYKNENLVNFELPNDDEVSGKETVKINYNFTHFKDGVDYSSVSMRVCPGKDNTAYKCTDLGRISDAGKSGIHQATFEFGGNEGAYYTLVSDACRMTWCSEYTKVVKVTPVPCKPKATVDPEWVYPQKTYPGTAATVTVTLEEPPTSACTIELDVVAEDGTGGHNHNGDRDAHTGALDKTIITFDANDTGPETVIYTSNEPAGIEKIKYRFLGKTEWNDLAEVEVKVEGLYPMYDSFNLNLTGQTGTHKENHYGTYNTTEKAWFVANDFYKMSNVKLGVNDMSLELGGLFDICATWNREDTCRNAPNGGHKGHRRGTSVDIDRCAENIGNPDATDQYCSKLGYSKGYIRVDRIKFETICNKNGGGVEPEATLHCEIYE